MSDIEDILPKDSMSQLSQLWSFSTNLSSHIAPSDNELPVPQEIKVNRCIIVVNTLEYLSKLVDHFNPIILHYVILFRGNGIQSGIPVTFPATFPITFPVTFLLQHKIATSRYIPVDSPHLIH